MSNHLFPTSYTGTYRQFEFEVMERNVFRFPHLLDNMRDQIFSIAAASRGWDDEQALKSMRAHFKIGPLYEANGVVLIRKNGVLVGLGGCVNNWHTADKSIVHLCSLGLLREVQNRGFLGAMIALLWMSSLQDARLRKNFGMQRVYISAITQSPYILAFLSRLFDVYPSPNVVKPDTHMVDVATQVAARFDADIPFDPMTFILRNECSFFYKRTPYSSNREINKFCDDRLRYDQGDVFVIVGRVIPDLVERYVNQVAMHHPELFTAFKAGLEPEQTGRFAQALNQPVIAETNHG